MPWNRESICRVAVAAALLAGGAVHADEQEAAPEAAAQDRAVLPSVSQSRPPLYPAEARQLGQQGRVRVRALVDAQGRLVQAEIKESSGYPLLDQAALDAVRLWTFTPGTRHGAPVAMWSVIPVSFSLDGKAHPAVSRSWPPFYPPEARHLGQQGRVVVRALVDAQGKVAQVEVKESSGHPLLDQAALATVRGWAFTPGSRNGTPEAMWARIPINFSLDGKAGK